MSEQRNTAILEIVVCTALIAIAAAFIVDSLGLPESLREPLGSARIPQIVCATIIIFCASIIWRALGTLRAAKASVPQASARVERADQSHGRRYDLSFGIFVLGVAYVFLMQTRAVGSAIVTPLFLILGMLLLTGFQRRYWPAAIGIGLVVGLGTHFLFKDFFYVDLP